MDSDRCVFVTWSGGAARDSTSLNMFAGRLHFDTYLRVTGNSRSASSFPNHTNV